MLSARVLNLRTNSYQPEGHDPNHNNQQRTKDTSNNLQKGQSSQYTNLSPTKHQESISRRRTSYKPEYQKFFLLVFLQEKSYVNNLGSFQGSKIARYVRIGAYSIIEGCSYHFSLFLAL